MGIHVLKCMYDFVGNFVAGDLGDEETDRSDSDAVPRGRQVSGRCPHPPPPTSLDLHHPGLLLCLLDHHPGLPRHSW